jgi:hypothetical protein
VGVLACSVERPRGKSTVITDSSTRPLSKDHRAIVSATTEAIVGFQQIEGWRIEVLSATSVDPLFESLCPPVFDEFVERLRDKSVEQCDSLETTNKDKRVLPIVRPKQQTNSLIHA